MRIYRPEWLIFGVPGGIINVIIGATVGIPYISIPVGIGLIVFGLLKAFQPR